MKSVRRSTLFAVTTVAAISTLVVGMTPAGATTPTVGQVAFSNTPYLLQSPVYQQVRRLVPCGSLMYAVGTIAAVGRGTSTYAREGAFSFDQTTGAMTDWAPNFNGDVNDIAFSPDCSVAYVGGKFTQVNGVSANHVAAISTSTGNLITTFKHSATAAVYTVDYVNDQVIVGGAFQKINGAARTEMASLNPTTGAVTSYLNLPISGKYVQTSPHVDNSQVSHDGTRLLIEGVFTSIAGQTRQQMAVLDLGGTSVTLDGWNAPQLNQSCVNVESYYTRAGAWSPDDQTIYGVSTGYKPLTGSGSYTWMPRSGLCDAAFAFPSAAGAQSTKWINYTGCDSYYGVVADDSNVYVTGHERWANNPNGCDAAGPGAVSRPGLADLDPNTGQANSWNPTRSLGHGGDDLVLTEAGLWVASDTYKQGKSQMCAHKYNKGGICFLPY